MTTAGDGPLPDDLADDAGLQLTAATGTERLRILEALVAAHPRYEAGLRRLHRDLARVDDVIAGAYRTVAPADCEQPDRIGAHRVVRRLGEGAFGIVWLCAQETPVTRLVAVKVLRPDAGGKQTLQRFAAERQLLASLNHPAITQVFDAGQLPDGRPFFVMEYVDGEPLHRYCETRSLGVRERLRLFADVCRGTAHAHARGIVHRDLKPANVLVVDTETGPAAKIIDFGIGKALFPATADGGHDATEAGRVVGTPGYMSPEQASGRVDAIDARTDVFALGVMLYELLTGELPWPRGASATTADPPRPSARAATSSGRVAAELRGDLDWITGRALAREPADRYAAANVLADDVERHLHGEPVSAGPPSLAYRLRKFVRRNRAAVATAAIAGTLVVAAWFGFEASRNNAEEQERQATLAVERLLARASDERLQRSTQNDIVRQGLAEDALAFYDRWLRNRPTDRRLRTGRCRALLKLSQLHFLLGQTPDAERVSAEAIDEAQSLHDELPGDLAPRALLADALRRKGRALAVAGRANEAKPLLLRAVEHLEACCRQAPADHSLSLSAALRELSTACDLLEQDDECLASARRSMAVLEQEQRRGSTDARLLTDLAIARAYCARILARNDAPDEAVAVLAAAEASLAEVTNERPRVAAVVHGAAAQLARERGDLPSAIARLQLVVAAEEEWWKAEPGRWMPGDALLVDLGRLAKLLDAEARWSEADATLQRAVEVAEATARDFPDGGEGSLRLQDMLCRFANQRYDRQRLTDLVLAEQWARRAIEVGDEIDRLRGSGNQHRTRATVLLAMILDARGQSDPELWERVASGLEIDADVHAPRHEMDFSGWLGVATSRARRGAPEPAQAALDQAARWVGDPPKHPTQLIELERVKAWLAVRRGDARSAVAAAERMLAVRSNWLGWWRAGNCYCDAWQLVSSTPGHDPALAGEYREQAAGLLRRVVDALAKEQAAAPTDPWHAVPWGFAGLRLAQIEAACGRAGEARKLIDTALAGLAAVADVAHRDLWQPEVFADAQALRATLPEPDHR